MQLKHFSLIFSARVIFSLKILNVIGSFWWRTSVGLCQYFEVKQRLRFPQKRNTGLTNFLKGKASGHISLHMLQRNHNLSYTMFLCCSSWVQIECPLCTVLLWIMLRSLHNQIFYCNQLGSKPGLIFWFFEDANTAWFT